MSHFKSRDPERCFFDLLIPNRHGRGIKFLLFVLFFHSTVAGEDSRVPPVRAEEYVARRAEVVRKLAESSPGKAALFQRARRPARYSNDVEYPYRPDSNLLYLTGIDQSGVELLLTPEEIEDLGKEILFLPPETPSYHVWIGKRLTRAQASEISGIPVRSILQVERSEELLGKAIPHSLRPVWHPHHGGGDGRASPPVFYFDIGRPFAAGESVTEGYGFLLKVFGAGAFHMNLRPPGALIHPLRQVKSPTELAAIQKAVDATCKAHRKAMRLTRAGLYEYHLAAEIEATFRREGCRGWAFPSIVGSGPNSCILHYQRYDRQLQSGEVVLMDIGAEYGYYAADVTRTIPVNGRFTARQRAIYEIVYEAQEATIREIRPGISYREVHHKAFDGVATGLIRLGLISEKKEARRYFLHNASHGLGLDVHDPMPERILREGMVITVEPGIYIPEEELGVRLEDDVVVTQDGCLVLSGSLPRTAEDIERWMGTREF